MPSFFLMKKKPKTIVSMCKKDDATGYDNSAFPLKYADLIFQTAFFSTTKPCAHSNFDAILPLFFLPLGNKIVCFFQILVSYFHGF